MDKQYRNSHYYLRVTLQTVYTKILGCAAPFLFCGILVSQTNSRSDFDEEAKPQRKSILASQISPAEPTTRTAAEGAEKEAREFRDAAMRSMFADAEIRAASQQFIREIGMKMSFPTPFTEATAFKWYLTLGDAEKKKLFLLTVWSYLRGGIEPRRRTTGKGHGIFAGVFSQIPWVGEAASMIFERPSRPSVDKGSEDAIARRNLENSVALISHQLGPEQAKLLGPDRPRETAGAVVRAMQMVLKSRKWPTLMLLYLNDLDEISPGQGREVAEMLHGSPIRTWNTDDARTRGEYVMNGFLRALSAAEQLLAHPSVDAIREFRKQTSIAGLDTESLVRRAFGNEGVRRFERLTSTADRSAMEASAAVQYFCMGWGAIALL